MIKLLHVITDTNTGGAGILLINQLKYFHRDIFDISVILPQGSELAPKIKALGYPVTETEHGADKSFELTAIREYKKIIRNEKPDIVHCHGALSARIAAYLCRVPVRIYTRHCAYYPPAVMRHFPVKQLCGGVNSMLSTGIVAVAEAAADDLIATGVPGRKITVIINGVEPLKKLSDGERSEIRRRLGFSDGDFLAGIFARLEECKGHIYLLKALKVAAEKGSRLKILICGKGSLDVVLKHAASELGISDRVVFTGFIDDITPYMNAVDVNVNCSVGTETSSLALSEGMSIGKPAVVSDYGGNPHMVENGVSGFIVPRADPGELASALLRLENDRILTERMGAAAYSRYTVNFTAAVMTEKLESLYTCLLHGSK